jgi:hypothetical protein
MDQYRLPQAERRVQLELLASIVVPAIMPLSWDFVAHRFASFGVADRRLPE